MAYANFEKYEAYMKRYKEKNKKRLAEYQKAYQKAYNARVKADPIKAEEKKQKRAAWHKRKLAEDPVYAEKHKEKVARWARYNEEKRASMSPEERAAWAQQNKEKSQAKRNRLRAQRKAFLLEYKSRSGCIDCGEDDPLVLDFDHRNPSEKVCAISQLVHKSCSMKKLMHEVEKCDVRCANCHRKRTAIQFGYHLSTQARGAREIAVVPEEVDQTSLQDFEDAFASCVQR